MSTIYKQASQVLSGLLKQEGGLKTLAFSCVRLVVKEEDFVSCTVIQTSRLTLRAVSVYGG